MIAQNLYSVFCRDIDQPLSRGLGIPVFFRSASVNKSPIPIDPYLSARNAIVLLIDQNYFIDASFESYTNSLADMESENTRIYPVQLCEQATDLNFGKHSFQFIRAFQGGLTNMDYKDLYGDSDFDLTREMDFAFSMQRIKSELLHDLARLMMNIHTGSVEKNENGIPPPVTLFLSHAKKDGLDTTKRFKAFVESESKLDVFFDAVDIADGFAFERQIEENIRKSALVVFHTDEYSAREWCRIEVMIAKRNKCSIVVVHDIRKGERRAFPYLGNTPTLTVGEDEHKSFQQIVDLTLYQVLNNLFQLELLDSFRKVFQTHQEEFVLLTSPPELFNYADIYRKKKESARQLVVLYPEPPLGAEELKILNDLDPDLVFITPVLLPLYF